MNYNNIRKIGYPYINICGTLKNVCCDYHLSKYSRASCRFLYQFISLWNMSESELSHVENVDTSNLLHPVCCDGDHAHEHHHEHEHEHEHEHDHEHDHDHDHCHDHPPPKLTWRLVCMIVLTGIFFLVELVTGFITKSLALQSDAFHMLTDLAALIVGLVAHRYTKVGATSTMSFGWARAEVLGGLTNATFLLAICVTILFEAITRFFDPEPIREPTLFIVVGTLGLIVNLLGLCLFHNHSHSENIEGVFLHLLGDLLGSIGVVISASVVKFTQWKYKDYLDPAISVVIVIILIAGAQSLYKKTARIVLEAVPPEVDLEKIKEDLLLIDGMVSIHDLHVWEINKKRYIGLMHCVVDQKEKNKQVKTQTHNVMMNHKIFSSTVQVEFVDDFPEGIDHSSSCYYAAASGSDKRFFPTTPVYKHSIGCPHINLIEDSDHGHEHHDHEHHDHEHHDHEHHDHEHHDHEHHDHEHHDHEHHDHEHHDHEDHSDDSQHDHSVESNHDNVQV